MAVTGMPRYKVEINGQNFLIHMEGQIAKYGFFTTRFVEATDSTAAENTAVQMIRETQRLRELVRNAPDMDVIGITEMESVDGTGSREPGFAWYEERPKRWWQFWRR
jgi:hypothetical protein